MWYNAIEIGWFLQRLMPDAEIWRSLIADQVHGAAILLNYNLYCNALSLIANADLHLRNAKLADDFLRNLFCFSFDSLEGNHRSSLSNSRSSYWKSTKYRGIRGNAG